MEHGTKCKSDNDDVLLIIDVQNEFCPGGRAGGCDGDGRWCRSSIRSRSALIRRADAGLASLAHSSFATSHPVPLPLKPLACPTAAKPCARLTACRALRSGRHPALEDRAVGDGMIRKGLRPAISSSYSRYRKRSALRRTGLAGYLRERGLQRIFMAGA